MTACVWPVSYAECATCSALDQVSDPLVYEQMAVDFLWNWTGGSLGLCPVLVRPCRQDCEQVSTFWGRGPYPSGGGSYHPVLISGSWHNISCGSCGGDECSCQTTSSLKLPGPVNSVESVTIDGGALDPSAYRIDNHYLLVRQDGGEWPVCQDLSIPPGMEGTWEIEYTRGAPVPVGGQIAAGVLACELAKAACRDESCQLPARIKNITRQGVTVSLLDDFSQLDGGKTGIWLIDSWMASITKPPRPSRVYSPDMPRPNPRVTTWVATP